MITQVIYIILPRESIVVDPNPSGSEFFAGSDHLFVLKKDWFWKRFWKCFSLSINSLVTVLKRTFLFELVCLQFFKPRLDPDRVTRILDLDLDINYYNSNPTEKYFKDTVVCFILTEQNFSSCRVKEAFNLFNCVLFSFSPR